MKIEVVSLPSPDVEHILTSELPDPKFPDRDWYWRFRTDYETLFKIDGDLLRVRIKKGFTSDGASIPRITGVMKGLAFRIYFVHDQLYTNHLTSRKEADLILKSGLEFENVDNLDIDIIYRGVRWFGGTHYDED